ncbi:hypothetical protein [Pseudomonas sp. MWU16-30317]|uniref:hypothetical protein n=1 Tax=Pseudomonas sp. MWU16-30317 TaxID=2878095 RepID=UPI001CF9C960|nr:hypothetical protein [Pseudomonas sp. MWU16-30317]
MKIQNGELAPAGSACPGKANELFYVTHPKAPRPLLGPFLSSADAEQGRQIMRCADAQVLTVVVESIDQLTRWRVESNGQVIRLFASSSPVGASS